MSILVNKNTRVLVQGITGKTGRFHTEISLKYGTRIVAGITPGKGGEKFLGVPVFDSVKEAQGSFQIDASVIFVPAAFAYSALTEALDGGIGLVVVVTEGVPVLDMLRLKSRLKQDGASRVIGPNCPGILIPDQARIGIIPVGVAKEGAVGVVSRSGTLTYEAMDQIARAGLGVSSVVGIGGDPVPGSSFIDILQEFEKDPQTQAVLMIGEIGGRMEEDAAIFWKETIKSKKPLFSFIAGKTAPPGRRMGHAGAIMEGPSDSAAAKGDFLREKAVVVIEELNTIGKTLQLHH